MQDSSIIVELLLFVVVWHRVCALCTTTINYKGVGWCIGPCGCQQRLAVWRPTRHWDCQPQTLDLSFDTFLTFNSSAAFPKHIYRLTYAHIRARTPNHTPTHAPPHPHARTHMRNKTEMQNSFQIYVIYEIIEQTKSGEIMVFGMYSGNSSWH